MTLYLPGKSASLSYVSSYEHKHHIIFFSHIVESDAGVIVYWCCLVVINRLSLLLQALITKMSPVVCGHLQVCLLHLLLPWEACSQLYLYLYIYIYMDLLIDCFCFCICFWIVSTLHPLHESIISIVIQFTSIISVFKTSNQKEIKRLNISRCSFGDVVQRICLGRCVFLLHLSTAIFSKNPRLRLLSCNQILLIMEGNYEAKRLFESLVPQVSIYMNIWCHLIDSKLWSSQTTKCEIIT